MKVLLLIRQLAVGGAERQLINVARGLKSREIDVQVAVFYGGGALEPELSSHDIPIFYLRKSGRWDVFAFLFRFLKFISTIRPSIIYGFLTGPNLCALVARARFRNQVIIWGIRAATGDRSIRRKDSIVRFAFWLSKVLAMLPDRIIANSISSRNYLIGEGFPSHRVTIIPNGTDMRRFVLRTSSRQDIRASYGVPDTALLIGIVARVDPIKDHSTFIHAAGLFLEKSPDTVFMVIGGGSPEYIAQLKSLSSAQQLGPNLIWAGEQYDIVGYYNALDINTLTSKSESFPNSLCEAMACGTPCVSTNVGDARRIIDKPELLFQVGDVAGLVTAWQNVLTLQSNRALTKAKLIDHIASHFSEDLMVDKTIAQFYSHLSS